MTSQEGFEKKAARFVGKYVFVGISTCDSDENVLSRTQVHGTIKSVKGGVITLELAGAGAGNEYTLPPDVDAFEKTDPRIVYRLRSTGEEVTGVEYIATWKILPPGRRGADEPGEEERDSAQDQHVDVVSKPARGIEIPLARILIALGLFLLLGYLSNFASAQKCEDAVAREQTSQESLVYCPLVYPDLTLEDRDLYSPTYSIAILARIGVTARLEASATPEHSPCIGICRACSSGPFVMRASYCLGGAGERCTYLCLFGLVFKVWDTTPRLI